MNFGSTFTGIGGFDLGFERAGMTCAWQVEIDGDCNRVLQRRFPKTERHTDVTTIGRLAAIDVLCGGFPCQDLSVAGKRAGLAGERSGLWFQFLRLADLHRPRWLVIENVPGLLSGCGCVVCRQVVRNLRAHSIWRSRYLEREGTEYTRACAACDAGQRLLEAHSGRNLAIILAGLVELGYCLAWRVLDAQFYRVAQRRRRVFIVGSLGNGRAAEVLFESSSVSWNPPSRGQAGQRAAASITSSFAKHSGRSAGNNEGADNLIDVGRPLAHASTANHYDESQQTYIVGSLAAHAKKHGHAMTTQQAAESNHLVTHALRAEGADASEDGTDRGTPLVTAPLNAEAIDVRSLRMQPDGISGTLQHKKSGGHSLNYQNPILAFSSKDDGSDAGEISPTLRSQEFDESRINGGGQAAIAWALHSQNSEAMTGDGNAQAATPTDTARSLDGGAGFTAGQGGNLVQQPVSFESRFARNGRGGPSEVVPPLKAQSGQIGKGDGAPLVAFDHCLQGSERTFIHRKDELAQMQTRPDSVAGNFGVRRLTPRECERLQGFPDDWTLYDAEGKVISDSARYRMLGNAVVVNVAEWIGRRIMEIDQT